jgi:hypothetical protein
VCVELDEIFGKINEVGSHGDLQVSGEPSVHYKSYILQMLNPQFLSTTPAFQAHHLYLGRYYFNEARKDIRKHKILGPMYYNRGGHKEYTKWLKWYNQ